MIILKQQSSQYNDSSGAFVWNFSFDSPISENSWVFVQVAFWPVTAELTVSIDGVDAIPIVGTPDYNQSNCRLWALKTSSGPGNIEVSANRDIYGAARAQEFSGIKELIYTNFNSTRDETYSDLPEKK